MRMVKLPKRQSTTYASVAPKRLADRVIQNIASNESVTKRSHNAIVHTGHKTSQRIAPTVKPPPSDNAPQVASTFGDMPSQIRQVHKTSAYFTNADGDETRVMEDGRRQSFLANGAI
jgi:hypothetical protein